MKKKKLLAVIASVLVIGAIVVFFVNSYKSSTDAVAEPESDTPVQVQAAQRGDLNITYKASGSIKPIREVNITSKVMGVVDNVYKDIGDTVNENELLFTVDKKELQNQLNQANTQINQAQAGVEAARSALNRASGAASDQQLMQAENALTQAQSALEQAEIAYNSAKKDYDNSKILFDSGAVSKSAFDMAKTKLDNAAASLNAAKVAKENAQKSYELIKNSVNPSTVESAQAQLMQAQAAEQSARVQANMAIERINDANVRSPISGVVALKNVEVGQMTPSAAAFTIVDLSKVTVDVEVSEKYINSIHIGSSADIEISSLQGQRFEGRVVTVSPASLPQKAGYLVRVEIDNPDNAIKAGMFATASFNIGKKQDVLKIPLSAVIKDGGRNIVYALDGDTAKYHEVVLGDEDNEYVEVISGIEEGMQIIVKGQQFITEGEKVRVVDQ